MTFTGALQSPAGMGTVSAAAIASRVTRTSRCGTFGPLIAAACFLLSAASAEAINLSPAETARIGKRVWQNECGGTVAGLTSWNAGENFASLGIGHFIWYPAGPRGPFEESFPKFLAFALSRDAKLPEFLRASQTQPCPWSSRAEFERDAHSSRMEQLRQFLAATVDLQAEFLVKRLEEALPKMTRESGATDRNKIQQQFERVASTPAGCYALVDYVNFKGEGVLATERYHGEGWGLLQVLAGMSGSGDGANAAREFSESARAVLQRRVRNAPAERKESRWLAGWLTRVGSYTR